MKSSVDSSVLEDITGPVCGPKQYEQAAGQADDSTSMICGAYSSTRLPPKDT
jgi:hypothetical protein